MNPGPPLLPQTASPAAGASPAAAMGLRRGGRASRPRREGGRRTSAGSRGLRRKLAQYRRCGRRGTPAHRFRSQGKCGCRGVLCRRMDRSCRTGNPGTPLPDSTPEGAPAAPGRPIPGIAGKALKGVSCGRRSVGRWRWPEDGPPDGKKAPALQTQGRGFDSL